MKQVLKYPGSKWRIAEWIVSQIPKHHSYLEPFSGSGAVLFNKVPSRIETVNDLDNRVYKLFKLIRENPEALAKVISETPFSRFEYDMAYEVNENDDIIETSRKFLVQCWQVQIENRPAIELIKRFKYPNVLIYADPPYVLYTRTGKQYAHEMTDQDHVELLETLLQHPGSVIISGYQNELYDSILKGWNKNSINSNAEYYQGISKTEVIWMNFEEERQLKLDLI